MAPVTADCLFSMKVGDKVYQDADSDVMRSKVLVHRVYTLQHELDAACTYVVCAANVGADAIRFGDVGEGTV